MAQPLLCVTVAAPSIDELRRQRDEAARVADLVELRLDALGRRVDVDAALAGRRCPVIVTCRPGWEGGGYDGPEEARLRLLERAVRLGAEWVDIEMRAEHRAILALAEASQVEQRRVEQGFSPARGRGHGIVLSFHDFERMPRDLDGRYRAMRATGAEVVKLAGRAHALADCLPMLEVGRAAQQAGERVALVAMGVEGLPTRLLPDRFGSCWSYAGGGVAPGQMTAERMIGEFRYREVHAGTRLFGLVGRPIGHSVSAAMHNAAFRALAFDAVYVPFEARDASDFVRVSDAFGIDGVSVTAPFKVTLLDAVAEADEASRDVGALNTMVRRNGVWHGRNTDVAGFLSPLAGIALAGMRATVLGAGGAARAVVAGLRAAGAHVTVYGRDAQRTAAVAATGKGGLSQARAGDPPPGSWDLLVNATPIGTYPETNASPLEPEQLSAGIVYDLVYNPERTRLLRDAERAGCRTIGGLDMLVAQAALQFEWWTGLRAPVDVMREAARARVAAMAGAA